jgi:hypothetical protein
MSKPVHLLSNRLSTQTHSHIIGGLACAECHAGEHTWTVLLHDHVPDIQLPLWHTSANCVKAPLI